MSQKIKPVSRILLVRLSALGDCVAAIPVFLALRQHYPHAHIAWVVQDNIYPLLQNLPGLDELIIFPRKRWQGLTSRWKLIREALRFAHRLRRRRFDITVDVQSNSKSAVIAFCTRARIRIGHGKGEAKEISRWLNNRLVDTVPAVPHLFQRNLRLLLPLGIQAQHPDFSLPKNPWIHRKVEAAIHALGFTSPFVLLVPFAGKTNKEWAPERFTALAAWLARQSIPVMFLSSPGRRIETEAMLPEELAPGVPVGLSPECTIPELVELIRLAEVAVGGDTGPVHIAGALEKRTVALFGPTDPNRSKPWGPTTVFSLETEPQPIADAIVHVLRPLIEEEI